MEILSTGLTFSSNDLREQIEALNWEVVKIKFDSKIDRYSAEAKNESGLKLTRNGKTERLALSNLLMAITRRSSMPRLARWNTSFVDRLAEIAEAYSKAPLYETKASVAFQELAADCERRAKTISEHIQVQIVNDPEPYKNAEKLSDDVKKHRRLQVSRAGADHPLWTEQQVVAYRICHDVLGYVAAGSGWDWDGENLAFAHHAQLLPEEAQKALFTESIAGTAYAVYYKAYGQQKVALFPQFMDEAQEKENPHKGYPGVHPSQSIPAVPVPAAKHIVEGSAQDDNSEAHTASYAFGAFDTREMIHEGAETRNQLLQRANRLPEDKSQIVHQWPDGWSIRRLQSYQDMEREGQLVSNCLAYSQTDDPSPEWEGHPQAENDERGNWYLPHDADLSLPVGDHIHSLRDPDNIPHVTFHAQIGPTGYEFSNVLGRHNTEPKDEYKQRIRDWGSTLGGQGWIAPVMDDERAVPIESDWNGLWDNDISHEAHTAATGTGTINPQITDRNYNWQSPYYEEPVRDTNGLTLQEQYGDPIQGQAVSENASLISTSNAPSTGGKEWAYLNQQNPAELAVMKRAIVNAFRVVLLSPRKDLRWNAVHYQHISHIPGDEDRPGVYWDTLEKARQDWNEKRGFDPLGHLPYAKYIPTLINIMQQRHYDESYDAALARTKELLRDWTTEEQNKLLREDEAKPEARRREGFQIETKANYNLAKRIKLYIAESQPNLDHMITRQVRQQLKEEPINVRDFVHASTDWLDEDLYNHTPTDKTRYGAFMGNHLKAIAKVSQYVDQILQAALEDVHEHDAAGYHFRSCVLQLNIPGVGPKVCSFAWLLLQPMTSQLATIDTHMMDLLGKPEKEMNNRDYFGMERMLQAGRDAAGYQHIPMGQFQWGMWDYKRTGAGSHQDHSAMAVLDPTPHDSIDWAAKEQPINAQQALAWKDMWRTQPPEWWAQTLPARQQVWDDYQNEVKGTAQGKVPYLGVPDGYGPDVYSPVTSRTAMRWDDEGNALPIPPMTPDQRRAYVIHPQTGQHLIGRVGQSAMSHIMETMGHDDPREVWNANYQVGKIIPDDTGYSPEVAPDALPVAHPALA